MQNFLHDKVFSFCEAYRALNPTFFYWLRERNTKGRLAEGIWFQGNERYAFVGLYDRTGGTNRTRSIGLVFWQNDGIIGCHVEVVFNEEEDEDMLTFYEAVIKLLGGSLEPGETKFQKRLSLENGFEAATEFLNIVKPQIDQLAIKNHVDYIFITPEKFNTKLQIIQHYRKKLTPTDKINYILVNISWNSNDWKGVSKDKSGHKWVSEGNIPNESWNFDFDNKRNTSENIYGFAQFTKAPSVEGSHNLIIFYSQNQIVGFYGKAEVLSNAVEINKQESYNIIGSRPLCILLENKIQDVKEKGFLEDLQRVGQIGFSYLKKPATIKKILHVAAQLNNSQIDSVNNLLDWLQLDKYEDEYFKVCKNQNQEDLNFYIDYLQQLVRLLNLKSDDTRLVFSCKQNKLSFIVGQRYCLNLRNDNGKSEFGFISQTETNLVQSQFEGKIKSFYNTTDRWEDLNEYIKNINAAIQVELARSNVSGMLSSDNQYFRAAIFLSKSSMTKNMTMKSSNSLNMILFGPPGTGKTYHTVSEAVSIVDPDYYTSHSLHREKLQERFNQLLIKDWEKTDGQISFCTFHQSFSYEDFVEGIKPLKPEKDDKSIKYDIIDGIFKRICRLADASNNAQQLVQENLVSFTEEEFNKAIFYKISLGDTTKEEDKAIYDYCINNGVIAIGFAESIDFTDKNEEQVRSIVIDQKLDTYSADAINRFKTALKVGNYVMVSNGNNFVRALGKVTGEYEFRTSTDIRYTHFRKVEWVFSNVEIPVAEFYKNKLQQQTIYKLRSEDIIPDFFVRKSKTVESHFSQKNFVLVIDEINRGNVSSIFGELITLIEPTKRSGSPEALEVVLPYSKERFTVPSNVYIIGTMNTADRSIESLDTALRRRFSFKEMSPKPELITMSGKSKGNIEGIDIVKMLKVINERIEKLIDKDHKIGHSYFLDIITKQDLELIFKDKVIPLLEEYFFGDFGKIGLVLGNSFIRKEEVDDFEFAAFEDYDPQTEQDLKQRSVYKIQPVENWDYKSIYEPKPKA